MTLNIRSYQYRNRPGHIIIRDRYWQRITDYDKLTNRWWSTDGYTDNVRARIGWLENTTDILKKYGHVQYEIEYEDDKRVQTVSVGVPIEYNNR